ncbi:hypothetical protein FLX07_29255 [Microbispora bryophytorum]|nr:hypothetical protein FLX07_29255 [Microbispora bryophytorum]
MVSGAVGVVGGGGGADGTGAGLGGVGAGVPGWAAAITEIQASCRISPPRRAVSTRVESPIAYDRSKPSWLRTVIESSAAATTCPVWVNTVTVPHPSLAGTITSPCSAPRNGPTRGTSGVGVAVGVSVAVSAGVAVGVIVTVAVTTGSDVSAGGVTGVAADAAVAPAPTDAVSANAVARIMGWEMRRLGPPGPDDRPFSRRWGLVGFTVPPYRSIRWSPPNGAAAVVPERSAPIPD